MSDAPPAAGRFLVRMLAPPAIRDAIEGDLREAYARRASTEGIGAARRWYAWQVARSVLPLGLTRVSPAGVRRGAAGLAAGVLASSVVPFLAAAWIRPETLLAGLSLTLAYVVLAATTAFGGGYAAVRVARAERGAAIVGLVALLYAPALLPVFSDPGLARREAPWLLLVVCAALIGGVLAGRRVRTASSG